VPKHRSVAREVEDPDSGNLTLNHPAAERRSTNHRFGPNIGHVSMRTSRLHGMRKRPFNINGLPCADHGHPRAALDASDFLDMPTGCRKSPARTGSRRPNPCTLYALPSLLELTAG
jgi:hypothetical protein